jgi:hypothetical protein
MPTLTAGLQEDLPSDTRTPTSPRTKPKIPTVSVIFGNRDRKPRKTSPFRSMLSVFESIIFYCASKRLPWTSSLTVDPSFCVQGGARDVLHPPDSHSDRPRRFCLPHVGHRKPRQRADEPHLPQTPGQCSPSYLLALLGPVIMFAEAD